MPNKDPAPRYSPPERTFNAHLTGTDGSHISVHGNAHASTNAHGEVTVSFENMRVTCTG